MKLKRLSGLACIAGMLALPAAGRADDHGGGGKEQSSSGNPNSGSSAGSGNSGSGSSSASGSTSNPGRNGADDKPGDDHSAAGSSTGSGGNSGSGNNSASGSSSNFGRNGADDKPDDDHSAPVSSTGSEGNSGSRSNSASGSSSNSGRNGADDKPGDDHSAPGSSTGSGGNSGSGSNAASGSSSNSGRNGADDKPGDDHSATGTTNANPPAAAAEFKNTHISLASATGNSVSATGSLDIRQQGTQQKLKIHVEANVPDGTLLNVIANGVLIGTVRIRLNEGEFEIETGQGQALPSGLTPGTITSVTITNSSNATLLLAQFGAASGQPAPPVPAAMEKKEQPLVTTPFGASMQAGGKVELRGQGTVTQIKVGVEAKVTDGTVWTVYSDKGVVLGTLTFKLREAELQLEAGRNLPSGVTLSELTGVVIRDQGNTQIMAAKI